MGLQHETGISFLGIAMELETEIFQNFENFPSPLRPALWYQRLITALWDYSSRPDHEMDGIGGA
jgi:hypothetical protein